MLYVKRNDAGDIVATFANAQVEEQEALAEDHAEIIAFRAYLERRPSDPIRELQDEVSWLMSQSAPEAAPEPTPDPEPEHHFADLMLADETRDAELDALRARVAELEAAPVLELSNDPPAEALMEAYPDEDHAALKARILAEFASLRNMLVGHIPMTMEQLARLQALEHPKFQTWLQA